MSSGFAATVRRSATVLMVAAVLVSSSSRAEPILINYSFSGTVSYVQNLGGGLVVIGGDSHRLHEEIITSGGMLKEGRFSRLNVGELDKLLAAATNDEAFEPMQKHLLELWDKFAPGLAQSLEARMKDRTTGLQKKRGERADKEADDIKSILLELKKAIDTELNDPEYQQLSLFDDLERDQFERNKDFLRDRSKAIPAEIERETTAIKSRYADPQPRMFPVAVTFLVPEKMRKG